MKKSNYCSTVIRNIIRRETVKQRRDTEVVRYRNMPDNIVSQIAEQSQETQMQQPKTVTFCCNTLQLKAASLATQGTTHVLKTNAYDIEQNTCLLKFAYNIHFDGYCFIIKYMILIHYYSIDVTK